MDYTLLLKNGHLVDPQNGLDGMYDLAIANGKIAEVAPHIAPYTAQNVIDVQGLLVTPGLIDTHVHLVRPEKNLCAYAMLLKVGVTTALDMSGPAEQYALEQHKAGRGLTSACLHALREGVDTPTNNPNRAEVAKAIDNALAQGAFGIKIMGGHYPFTPEATKLIMEECHKRDVYVAIHAGTTATGSNILGLEEAVALADGGPLHLAHVNSYCRGQVETPLTETQRALDCLVANPNIFSESYLSVLNGTSASYDDEGMARSRVTRTCLQRKGYSPDKKGIEQAIIDGWCQIYAQVGDSTQHLDPKAGLEYWKRLPKANCSFAVNEPSAMVACLIARKADNSFVVNAVSTDGGVIPRNVIMQNGLALVRAGYITLPDLVAKATCHAAAMLKLSQKGHLSVGADADVSVFDQNGQAIHCITNGVVRVAGSVCVATGPGVSIRHQAV